MPSPVGHSLIGLTLGVAFLVARRRTEGWHKWLGENRGSLLTTVIAANACDLDYLPGLLIGAPNSMHRWLGHTALWAALAGIIIWLLWRRLAPRLPRGALPVLLAVALSHIVADYFDEDTRAPFGILALWPFYDGFLISAHPIFLSLQKTSLADVVSWHNVRAVTQEALLTLPALLVVVFYKLRPIRHDVAPTKPA
ncbi:MAG: metal-dependent hydrolase [Verrucomicrobia bacterium]|nr:MAG: metal-dependent hydrolase [Verrucomicrobiota bacterium]